MCKIVKKFKSDLKKSEIEISKHQLKIRTKSKSVEIDDKSDKNDQQRADRNDWNPS